MAFTFHFPDVGEGIHEGKIVKWLVAVGDAVKEDDVLAKVETDKAVVEIPSPYDGVVLKLGAPEGGTIRVGDIFAVIGEKGETIEGADAAPPKAEEKAEAKSAEEPAAEPQKKGKARRPLATPHTRAYARKKGVDLHAIEGTGKGGRITDEDVDRAAAGGTPAKAASAAAPKAKAAPAPRKAPAGRIEAGEEGPVEVVPVSHLRKVIAENMTLSKQTSAHVTHVDEADVTDLVALYKNAKGKVEGKDIEKLSLLPFFMKAIAAALKAHPLLNASYDEAKEEIHVKKFYNFGIAVDTDEGLIVPVVRDVDKKGILELADEVADMAERARTRSLSLDELQQGTFTITNIGPLGGLFATPIIRQPELAIVGLHTIQEKPAVHEGEIKVRKLMHLSVSFDHRIIDGAEAARFMTDLRKIVSAPELLMVKL